MSTQEYYESALPRSSHRIKTPTLTIVALVLSITSLCITLILGSLNVALLLRLTGDMQTQTAQSSKSITSTSNTANGKQEQSVQYTTDTQPEGDTYNNVHLVFVALERNGMTATLTVQATNNDTDNQYVLHLSLIQAFQNGAEISHDTSVDTDIPNLQPGASATIKVGFQLTDRTAPVTLELDHLGHDMNSKISAEYHLK